MRKRKIFKLLDLLDVENRKRFRDFLASPYFNTSKTLLKFYEHWCKRVLDVPPDKDVDADAFVKRSDFKVSRLDKLNSGLRAHLLHFLALQEWERSTESGGSWVLRALERHNADVEVMEELYNLAVREMEKLPEGGGRYLEGHWLHLFLTYAKIRSRETKAVWDWQFKDVQAALDKFYLNTKLRLAAGSMNMRFIFKREENLEEGNKVEGLMALLPEAHTPLARAFHHALQIQQEIAPAENFEALLTLMDAHSGDFYRADSQDLYGYALNFCIDRINRGELDFHDTTRRIYEQLLDKELLLENDKLPTKTFKNIVALQCRLGNLEWVRAFIDAYRERLSNSYDGQAVAYNEAVYLFHKGNYPEAIRVFQEVIKELKDDVFFGLDARVYLWKAWYERYDELDMEELDEMMRLYDAFRLFIDRNEKISANHKQHYRNFIRDFKRFLDILGQAGNEQKEKLRELKVEVEEKDFVTNKLWMLEKMEAALAGIGV